MHICVYTIGRLIDSWFLHACRFTGRTIHNAINMGSYNYLGFAENDEDFLKTVADNTSQYGVGVCSTRQEIGEIVVFYLPLYS